jgi:hypothetical protein
LSRLDFERVLTTWADTEQDWPVRTVISRESYAKGTGRGDVRVATLRGERMSSSAGPICGLNWQTREADHALNHVEVVDRDEVADRRCSEPELLHCVKKPNVRRPANAGRFEEERGKVLHFSGGTKVDKTGDGRRPDAFTGVSGSQPGETFLCLSGKSVCHVRLEGFICRGAAGCANKLPSPPSYGPVLWHEAEVVQRKAKAGYRATLITA